MKWWNKTLNSEKFSAGVFLLPAMVLIFIFIIAPVVMAFSYSFTDYHLLKPHLKEFIGIKNYIDILNDQLIYQTLKNTLIFVILVVPLQLSMALGIALLLNKKIRGGAYFKIAFFSPSVLSLVVISILWTILLNPTSGLVNEVFEMLNIPKQPFLISTTQAMPTITFISAWACCGYQMLIFLAGLKNIPGELYEAAKIDGASKWQQFLHITLPGLRPITIFLVITTTISAFKLIVQPMVMTGGGPDNATMTILQYIYEYGFRHRNTGYASAMTVVFTIFLIILSLAFKRLLKEEEN